MTEDRQEARSSRDRLGEGCLTRPEPTKNDGLYDGRRQGVVPEEIPVRHLVVRKRDAESRAPNKPTDHESRADDSPTGRAQISGREETSNEIDADAPNLEPKPEKDGPRPERPKGTPAPISTHRWHHFQQPVSSFASRRPRTRRRCRGRPGTLERPDHPKCCQSGTSLRQDQRLH